MWSNLSLRVFNCIFEAVSLLWINFQLLVAYLVINGMSNYTSLMQYCYWSCRFLLPATLIVINDIAAYIFGFFFGRTPLIKLSPKKTWEGFIGASFTTMISAFVVSCQDILVYLCLVPFWLACVYIIVPKCLPLFCLGVMEVDLYSIYRVHNTVCHGRMWGLFWFLWDSFCAFDPVWTGFTSPFEIFMLWG